MMLLVAAQLYGNLGLLVYGVLLSNEPLTLDLCRRAKIQPRPVLLPVVAGVLWPLLAAAYVAGLLWFAFTAVKGYRSWA
jgi:hypothetical protein